MRIALVHAHAWPRVRRGGERLLDDLAWYLRSSGHLVDVIVGTPGETLFRVGSRSRTLRVHHPHLRSLARLGVTPMETFAARTLGPLLARRYDVVHSLLPGPTLAARIAGQRTVYTVLGHPGPGGLPADRVQRWLLREAAAEATEVTVLSGSAGSSFEEVFGRPPTVLPPGIRLDRFPLSDRPRTGPPVVLFSGSLSSKYKGLDVLLTAFGELRQTHPDARLALSGPGDPSWALAQAGPSVRGTTDILGAGRPDELPTRYQAATVTVLPSRNEAFGLVLLESLACGTPVVGGTPGGPDDFVTSAGVGRVVPYGAASALSQAIAECIRIARRPGTPYRCRKHAELWSWSHIGPRYEELYRLVSR